jgi:hypothetical protein
MREAQEELLGNKPEFTYTTTHNGTDTILIGNIPVSPNEAAEIERIASLTQTSQQKVLQIRRLLLSAVPSEVQMQPETPKREDEEKRLRRECRRLGYRLSQLLGVEPQDIHLSYKKQKYMSVDELKAKKMKLLTQIGKHERN